MSQRRHAKVSPQPQWAAPLTALAKARTAWLAATVDVLHQRRFVNAAWLVGSLGQGNPDPYSDIDLVVAVDDATPPNVFGDPVAGLRLPGSVLFTSSKPRNAPADGGYLTACVELATLPVLVDLYLWPKATAALPANGRLLLHRTPPPPRTDLAFMQLLDRHRTSDTTVADPNHPTSVLLLVQLAAKYLARGDQPRHAAITRHLGLPSGVDTFTLRQILGERIEPTAHRNLRPAITAAHRLLDLVDTVIGDALPREDAPEMGRRGGS